MINCHLFMNNLFASSLNISFVSAILKCLARDKKKFLQCTTKMLHSAQFVAAI